jgi:RNA polymerase sigma-70 factor (ECF subfamily)
MDPTQSAALAVQWQAVWQQHAGWLRTVLRARVQDDSTADELLQAVSVAAWTRRDQLCDVDKVGPWLYRIALRQVLMFLRSQGRYRRRFVSLNEAHHAPPTHEATDPLGWLVRKEVHELVRESLHGMAAQDREILMLRHSEQWSYREIAEFLGVSADKVVYRLARARGRLRQRLQALGNDWESS